MSFNLERGLKSIINVLFWIWILLGIFFSISLLLRSDDFFVGMLSIGIAAPIILRFIAFYIIGSFFK